MLDSHLDNPQYTILRQLTVLKCHQLLKDIKTGQQKSILNFLYTPHSSLSLPLLKFALFPPPYSQGYQNPPLIHKRLL